MSGFFWCLPLVLAGGYLYWRYIWFFRNPPRHSPPGDNIVSPADGTVVYVHHAKPGEEIISIKRGVSARLEDILREDVAREKVHIGIFMSPFSVHYNRVPLTGEVQFIRHHPPQGGNYHMGAMHWRTLCGRSPFYRDSQHIVKNARTVTKINGRYKGECLPYYIVQIAGRRVHSIDSYTAPGHLVTKGEIFGLIRVGSQVDVVLTYVPGMKVLAKPGDRVRAGETILIS